MLTPDKLRDERTESENADALKKAEKERVESERIASIQKEAGPRLAAVIRNNWEEYVRKADARKEKRVAIPHPISPFEACYYAFSSQEVKDVIAEINAQGFKAWAATMWTEEMGSRDDPDFYSAATQMAELHIAWEK